MSPIVSALDSGSTSPAMRPAARPLTPGSVQLGRAWIAYAMGWVVLATLWSVVATMSKAAPAHLAARFGFVMMGSAGVMGVGVWWLTGKLPWDRRTVGFYAAHAAAASAYALGYTMSAALAEAFTSNIGRALGGAWHSPVFGWNILMGSWLYLIVAGLSYGIRTQQQLNAKAAAEAEARMLAERAQLSALRARLNPHFLFNALHTVSSLVTADPAAADNAIERLGGLLRYALDDSEDEVPLQREWAFTRDYLSFEKLRLGDRLRVCDALESDALTANVPLLVLQPLVENAVRHAIAPRPEGGTIHIRARVANGLLTLSVADDGPGAMAAPASGDHGIGLGALKRRLEVRYGAAATLDIRTAPGQGFAVTVALPAVPARLQAGAA